MIDVVLFSFSHRNTHCWKSSKVRHCQELSLKVRNNWQSTAKILKTEYWNIENWTWSRNTAWCEANYQLQFFLFLSRSVSIIPRIPWKSLVHVLLFRHWLNVRHYLQTWKYFIAILEWLSTSQNQELNNARKCCTNLAVCLLTGRTI